MFIKLKLWLRPTKRESVLIMAVCDQSAITAETNEADKPWASNCYF